MTQPKMGALIAEIHTHLHELSWYPDGCAPKPSGGGLAASGLEETAAKAEARKSEMRLLKGT